MESVEIIISVRPNAMRERPQEMAKKKKERAARREIELAQFGVC